MSVGVLLAVVSALTSMSFAQTAAPLGECDPCVVPVSEDCCIATKVKCYRYTYVETVIPGEEVAVYTLYQCINCCKFDPPECPGNDDVPDPKTCVFDLPAWTETLTNYVCPRVIDTNTVLRNLSDAIGIRLRTYGPETLTVEVPKCKAFASLGYVKYEEGRFVRLMHQWQLVGKWVNDTSDPWCLLYPCPTAGGVWVVGSPYCGENCYSSAVGNKFINMGFGELSPVECPIADPCD